MIIQKHPLYDLGWSLKDLWDFGTYPHMEDIMRYIEPNVVRGIFLPCWIWQGSYQTYQKGHYDERSYPLVRAPRVSGRPDLGLKPQYVHRYLARVFWDFPDNFVVYRECGRVDCVNVNHFVISHRNDPEFA